MEILLTSAVVFFGVATVAAWKTYLGPSKGKGESRESREGGARRIEIDPAKLPEFKSNWRDIW